MSQSHELMLIILTLYTMSVACFIKEKNALLDYTTCKKPVFMHRLH